MAAPDADTHTPDPDDDGLPVVDLPKLPPRNLQKRRQRPGGDTPAPQKRRFVKSPTEAFKKAFEELRQEANLSQRELAERLTEVSHDKWTQPRVQRLLSSSANSASGIKRDYDQLLEAALEVPFGTIARRAGLTDDPPIDPIEQIKQWPISDTDRAALTAITQQMLDRWRVADKRPTSYGRRPPRSATGRPQGTLPPPPGADD